MDEDKLERLAAEAAQKTGLSSVFGGDSDEARDFLLKRAKCHPVLCGYPDATVLAFLIKEAQARVQSEVGTLLQSCEPLIQKIVRRTGLAKAYYGNEEEARQSLRVKVVERAAEMFHAPPSHRTVALRCLALDIIRRHSKDQKRVRLSAQVTTDDEEHDITYEMHPDHVPSHWQVEQAAHLAADIRRKLPSLTVEEMALLEAICDGLTSKEMAKKFNVPSSTMRARRQRVLRKLDVYSPEEEQRRHDHAKGAVAPQQRAPKLGTGEANSCEEITREGPAQRVAAVVDNQCESQGSSIHDRMPRVDSEVLPIGDLEPVAEASPSEQTRRRPKYMVDTDLVVPESVNRK